MVHLVFSLGLIDPRVPIMPGLNPAHPKAHDNVPSTLLP